MAAVVPICKCEGILFEGMVIVGTLKSIFSIVHKTLLGTVMTKGVRNLLSISPTSKERPTYSVEEDGGTIEFTSVLLLRTINGLADDEGPDCLPGVESEIKCARDG